MVDGYQDDDAERNMSDGLYDIIFSEDKDSIAHDLFIEGVIKGDEDAYYELYDYLWDQYDRDLEIEIYDWEKYEQSA